MDKRIKQCVFNVMDELNQVLPDKQQIKISIETELFGPNGNLDSLGLVNLTTSLEELIEKELNVSISLANERAFSQKNSPFRTVKTIIDYVSLLVKESTSC